MGKIFSAPKPPVATVAPTPVMPTQDDDAIAAAKKKQDALSSARSGRVSTMLSDPGNTDTLGG